jgi:hypothetical protein
MWNDQDDRVETSECRTVLPRMCECAPILSIRVRSRISFVPNETSLACFQLNAMQRGSLERNSTVVKVIIIQKNREVIVAVPRLLFYPYHFQLRL